VYYEIKALQEEPVYLNQLREKPGIRAIVFVVEQMSVQEQKDKK
jgi:hypothetical protein